MRSLVRLAYVRWLFSCDIDADLLYYREVDCDGWLQREVVMFGPEFTLVTASTKFERLHARRTGQLAEFGRIYGDAFAVFERPIIDDDMHCDVTGDDFETAWRRGRAHKPQRSVQP